MKIKLTISEVNIECEIPDKTVRNIVSSLLPGAAIEGEEDQEPMVFGLPEDDDELAEREEEETEGTTDDQFYTTKDIMEIMKVKSEQTVHNRVAAEEFPSHTHLDGKKKLWDKETVDQWLTENPQEGE